MTGIAKPAALAVALAAGLTMLAGGAYAACDTAAHIQECTGKLDEGYQVLTTYALGGEKGEAAPVEDDTVLSTRMEYQLVICGPAAETSEFVLESGARERLLSNKTDDGFAPMVAIKPERMAVYYVVFHPPASGEFCGGAVLGIKR